MIFIVARFQLVVVGDMFLLCQALLVSGFSFVYALVLVFIPGVRLFGVLQQLSHRFQLNGWCLLGRACLLEVKHLLFVCILQSTRHLLVIFLIERGIGGGGGIGVLASGRLHFFSEISGHRRALAISEV